MQLLFADLAARKGHFLPGVLALLSGVLDGFSMGVTGLLDEGRVDILVPPEQIPRIELVF